MDLRRLSTYKIKKKKYPMTYKTALPSEVEKIKQAKRELAMTTAKKKFRFWFTIKAQWISGIDTVLQIASWQQQQQNVIRERRLRKEVLWKRNMELFSMFWLVYQINVVRKWLTMHQKMSLIVWVNVIWTI